MKNALQNVQNMSNFFLPKFPAKTQEYVNKWLFLQNKFLNF